MLLSVDSYHQHKPEADVSHSTSVPPSFLDILMAYSKPMLKSSGKKLSPSFIPFWIGKLLGKWLPIQTLLFSFSFHFNTF
jgi:hypothetical protein